MTPRHVDPIDEIQLLRRGLPSGAAAMDAETQTPPMGEALTTPVSERREPAEAPKVILPIGTRFGMMWLPEKGKAKQEYFGTIVEEIKRPGQSVMYRVKYDDYDEALFHDFARTKRVWRVIKVPKSQEREVRAKTRSLAISDASAAAATPSAEIGAIFDASGHATRETNKATQNTIDVHTDLGTAQ